MNTHPGIITLLGIAASVSLLSGWRLYLCILATGLAMHWHIVPLPEHLQALRVLASPWVMGAATLATLCEFFADKVPWIDTIWDTVHTAIRPIGGALLATAIVDPSDPTMQVVAFILGGGGALLAHSGKAGARAIVNVSPEPFSNIALSTTEDIATSGLLYVVYAYPYVSGAVAVGLLVLTGGMICVAWRTVGRIFRRKPTASRARP
ncbi:MAG: DUF4126 domain-containing protein [Methylovirgula sp.]|uniref:DUF4126 domain-containing protein n=1 Tax=Methylovirgula sp. TaxID=1978224 RepID=UPI0030764B47